jgi:hypothetical protein
VTAKAPAYGLLAEFDEPEKLLRAIGEARARGYRRMDAYTPYPIEEVTHALGLGPSKVPLIVFAGGLAGACGGFLFQYWAAVVAYPMNVGGRPLNSWPAFVIPTFETTVLFAALSAVLGMLALNGLPRPYHPVFNAESFLRASRDRYFLCIEARDPRYDPAATRRLLEGLAATSVAEVEE